MTPSATAVRAALCSTADTLGGVALIGRVVGATRDSAPVRVAARWAVLTLGGTGPEPETREATASTHAGGSFVFCGLPSDAPLALEARAEDGTVAAAGVVPGDSALAFVLLELPSPTPAVATDVGASYDSARPAPHADSASARATADGDAMVSARRWAELSGVVRDSAGRPLSGAEVVLLATAGQPAPVPGAGADPTSAQSTTSTRADGNFVLGRAGAEERVVEVRALGHRPTRLNVRLTEGRTTRIGVALGSTVPVLTAARVTARRSVTAGARAMLAGFERRRAAGAGRFVTRADIDRRRASTTTGLIGLVPGVRLVPGAGQFAPPQIAIARTLTGPLTNATCRTAVFVDGVRFATGPMTLTGLPPEQQGRGGRGAFAEATGQSLDALLRPEELHGIEVHASLATAPPEFAAPDAGCGIVLIWTRRGDAPVRP